MPWELTIRRRDGQPLGPTDAVCPYIEAAFPGVQFYREPSGPEKVAAAARAGLSFPPFLMEHMQNQPATEQAEREQDCVSVRFFLGEPAFPVLVMGVEERGDHVRAEPLLRELARLSGWGIDHWAAQGHVPFAG